MHCTFSSEVEIKTLPIAYSNTKYFCVVQMTSSPGCDWGTCAVIKSSQTVEVYSPQRRNSDLITIGY